MGYKTEKVEGTVADFVEDAYSEFQALGEEMRTWADGLNEGNLGQTDKYSAIDECASALEEYTEAPEVPGAISDEKVDTMIMVPDRRNRQPSRATRLENAIGKLQCVASLCESAGDDLENSDLDEEEKATATEEIDTFKTTIEEVIDNLSGVEFPGMYG